MSRLANRVVSIGCIGSFVLLLSSCSPVTPVSAGSVAGKYFATRWKADHGSSDYPSVDAVSVYCVDVGETFGRKNSWTYNQMRLATDSCVQVRLSMDSVEDSSY